MIKFHISLKIINPFYDFLMNYSIF